MKTLRLLVAPLLFLTQVSVAAAAEADVQMLNKSPTTKERMVFEPNVVRIDVGDTVNWLAASKGHNVEFIKGAVPEGIAKFKTPLGKDASFTFEKAGIYVYKCSPHFGMGMIGMVIVGDDTSNLEAAQDVRYPGKAKKRSAEMFDSVG